MVKSSSLDKQYEEVLRKEKALKKAKEKYEKMRKEEQAKIGQWVEDYVTKQDATVDLLKYFLTQNAVQVKQMIDTYKRAQNNH